MYRSDRRIRHRVLLCALVCMSPAPIWAKGKPQPDPEPPPPTPPVKYDITWLKTDELYEEWDLRYRWLQPSLSKKLETVDYPLIVGSRRIPSWMFVDGVERQWGFILTPSAISGGAAATAIPEPASFVLACLGMLMLINHRRFERG